MFVTEQLKQQCGLPCGLTVQPFARVPQLGGGKPPKESASQIARCSECYSWVPIELLCTM